MINRFLNLFKKPQYDKYLWGDLWKLDSQRVADLLAKTFPPHRTSFEDLIDSLKTCNISHSVLTFPHPGEDFWRDKDFDQQVMIKFRGWPIWGGRSQPLNTYYEVEFYFREGMLVRQSEVLWRSLD